MLYPWPRARNSAFTLQCWHNHCASSNTICFTPTVDVGLLVVCSFRSQSDTSCASAWDWGWKANEKTMVGHIAFSDSSNSTVAYHNTLFQRFSTVEEMPLNCVKAKFTEMVCPSNHHGTQCRVFHHRLVLLDNERSRVLNFKQRSKSKKCRIRLLDLPLELKEKIFSYLLLAPAEIFMGVVVLEPRLPHHFHPQKLPMEDMQGLHPQSNFSLVRTPVCAHKRAAGPLGLSVALLRVNKQLHNEASRTLYSRNAFAIDLAVPETESVARQYDVSTLDLEDIIPLNPAYHKLLRTVDFRCFNEGLLTYPVRFFHSAMMHVLRDMPGCYTAFRRSFDPKHGGYDFEAFAGWSGTATPTWLHHACLSLSGHQPLVSTTLDMNADDAHWNTSNLWESVRHCTPTVTSLQDKSSDDYDEEKCLDLQVLSDPEVHAEKWNPKDPESWQAGRIFLLRPRINELKYQWRRTDKPRAGILGSLSLRLQTYIIGISRGLRPKPYSRHRKMAKGAYHPYVPATRHQGYVPGPAWKRAATGKRRLLTSTAPMGLPIQPICRTLRDVLHLEGRRGENDVVNGGPEAPAATLPVDEEGIEIPEHHRPGTGPFIPHYMGFYDIQYNPDVERWPFTRYSLTYHLSGSERKRLGLSDKDVTGSVSNY